MIKKGDVAHELRGDRRTIIVNSDPYVHPDDTDETLVVDVTVVWPRGAAKGPFNNIWPVDSIFDLEYTFPFDGRDIQ